MTLLDEVLEAHGGIDRWDQLRQFTVHISIGGALLTRKGMPDALKEMVISGCTKVQTLCITGFTAPNKRAVYSPDAVIIESLDGVVLEERQDPRSCFDVPAEQRKWDNLYLAYFCSYVSWICLTSPFLFARPGFQTEELGPWQRDGETWRRLKVIFPPDVVTHSPEQIFFFDQNGLERRADFRTMAAGGAEVTNHFSAHQSFGGIVVPTLRRAMRVGDDGIAMSRPALVEVEIFDAVFE
jgi:hypothetical protein